MQNFAKSIVIQQSTKIMDVQRRYISIVLTSDRNGFAKGVYSCKIGNIEYDQR